MQSRFCFRYIYSACTNQKSKNYYKIRVWNSQPSIFRSPSQSTDITKLIFWFLTIYFEILVVWDNRSWNAKNTHICVQTIFFDIRGCFEISVFEITRGRYSYYINVFLFFSTSLQHIEIKAHNFQVSSVFLSNRSIFQDIVSMDTVIMKIMVSWFVIVHSVNVFCFIN